MGSTAVRYLTQQMLARLYTLECTQQAVVSDSVRSRCVLLYCLQKRFKRSESSVQSDCHMPLLMCCLVYIGAVK